MARGRGASSKTNNRSGAILDSTPVDLNAVDPVAHRVVQSATRGPELFRVSDVSDIRIQTASEGVVDDLAGTTISVAPCAGACRVDSVSPVTDAIPVLDAASHDVILQVLVTKTAMGYEAHCLPMDIVHEAPTVEQAIEDLIGLIRAQYRYARDTQNLASAFVPAPPEDWQKLAHAKPTGALRSIDLSGHSEHVDDAAPSYALQALDVVPG